MKVGIKYCGGCNPRFNRKSIVERLERDFPEAEIFVAKETKVADWFVVICGCTNGCATHDDLIGTCGKFIITSYKDYPGMADKIREYYKNKEVKRTMWKETYQSKLTTAEEAVKLIKSGDRVIIGHAVGEPSYIVEAMVANAAAYENVEIVHMVAMGKCEYCKPEYEKNFRHNALFAGGGTRKAIEEGRADFTPIYFSQIPSLIESWKPEVALVTVTPPDEDGYCSLGISVDYTYAAAKSAKTVIAQVNNCMPYTYGNSKIHVDDITCFVEHDAPIIELPEPPIGDIEREIGRHCASLINDGDCLQLGIGAIPDAVLSFLHEKKDLGIHSEMFSTGVVQLAKEGVINNSKKTLHPGKFVANFLMGTQTLYDFADHNPDVEMYPADYVNDPYVVGQNDNLVSINSCVEVDLMGQVVSTCIGPKQISGVGGQVDFVRGSQLSKGGRSILAMPSTVKGKASKIVPLIAEGAAVTTSRYDVQYIVTEYGIADLKGQTLKERARRLIKIAHPDFRPELIEYYENKFKCKYED